MKISLPFHPTRRPAFAFSLAAAAGIAAPAGAAPLPGGAPGAATQTPILISEMRAFGPGGGEDAFVELFNASNQPVSVSGWQLQFLGEKGVPASLRLPPGAKIGARGHWLLTGRAYSLQNVAAGDLALPGAIAGGVRLCDASGQLIDAVGPRGGAFSGTQHGPFREGAGLASLSFPAPVPASARLEKQTEAPEALPQFSSVRLAPDGEPQDSGDNARDFTLVSVAGTLFGQNTQIGAPGPENSRSPRLRPRHAPIATDSPQLQTIALQTDPARNSMKRARRETGKLKTHGTMTLHYRFVNEGKTPLKSLYFRVNSITCDPDLAPGSGAAPASNETADVRLIRGKAAPAKPTIAQGSGVTKLAGMGAKRGEIPVAANIASRPSWVWKARLASAPATPLGGGLNALLNVELPAAGIAPGARGEIVFSFGVERTGNYRVVLSNQTMNLVFEGHTESDQSGAGGATLAGLGRPGAMGATSRVTGAGNNGSGGQNAGAGAGNGAPADAATETESEEAEGIVIEGNTEDGVIVPPVKPSDRAS